MLLILYGSETGTAQDVAESLWNDARRRKIACKIAEMDDYDVQAFPKERSTVVFIVSTTGQGEPPTNSRNFWTFIRRKYLPLNSLSQLKMAVFGLGDSTYQKYNFAAKIIFRRLVQLGAIPIHQSGVDTVWNLWRSEFWTTIYPGHPLVIPTHRCLPAKFRVHWLDDNDSEVTNMPHDDVDSESTYFAHQKCIPVPILENIRVTSTDHFQDTRLISFDTSRFASVLSHKPGDVLLVHPRNLQESLEIALEALNFDESFLKRRFKLTVSDGNGHLPTNIPVSLANGLSVKQAFESYFDLQAIPRRSFFTLLSQLAKDDDREADKLAELSLLENQQDLFDYCNRPRRTIAETLRDFKITAQKSIPFDYLFDLLPTVVIRRRSFSIASFGGPLQILVAKVAHRTVMSQERRGLCSTFLSRLEPQGQLVYVGIGKGTFNWPSCQQSNALILIGPGTGVAPFRSLVQFRQKNQTPGSILLFFGCRHPRKDFYFEMEWSGCSQLTLIPAFSREYKGRKVYVQDKMVDNSSLIWRLISVENSYVFVAGNAKQMPVDVRKCLVEIVQKHCHHGDGDKFVTHLEKTGRLQFETWS